MLYTYTRSYISLLSFEIWSQDVRQAYLKSGETSAKDIYRTTERVQSVSRRIIRTIEAAIRSSKSGDYWCRAIVKHLTQDLNMSRTKGDLCLFFKIQKGKREGIIGQYVGDLFSNGTNQFMDLAKQTLEKCKSRERELHETLFVGIKVMKKDFGCTLSQNHYAKKLKILQKMPILEITAYYDINSHGFVIYVRTSVALYTPPPK